MLNIVLATSLAFAAQGSAGAATDPAAPVELTLQQQTSLRCSAAFALVQRDRNTEAATHPDYPEMDVRGKEFFVRSGAQIMDETGINRGQFEDLVYAEIDILAEPGKLAEVMPGCLLLLEASGI